MATPEEVKQLAWKVDEAPQEVAAEVAEWGTLLEMTKQLVLRHRQAGYSREAVMVLLKEIEEEVDTKFQQAIT